MFKVAELVATLRLDKGSYKSDMDASKQQMRDLGQDAVGTGSKLGGALVGGLRAASVAAVGLTVATGATLKNLLSTGVAYNTLQQTSRAAMATLMGGAEAANVQMDKLDAFAKTSPFSKSVFIQAQQQLIGFGMAADKVLPTLGSIQDAVAAVGGSSQDISDITLVLAQIQSAGKITGEDLMQLAGRGINAAELIGTAMGKTGPEIKEAISKGTIGGQEALDALVDQMGIKFAGAAANVKNTMTGASDRVKSATRDIGAALAEPFVSKGGGGRLIQWANDWADALRAIEKRTPSVVSMLVDRFSPAMNGVSIQIAKIKAEAQQFDISKIDRAFDTLGDNLPAVAAITGAVLGLTSGALAGIPVIGGLVGGLNPLAAALVGVAVASPELREVIGDVFEALKPLLPAVASLAGALSGLLSASITATVPLLDQLVAIIKLLVGAGVPLLGMVEDVADAFSGLPPEIQSMVIAFGLFMALRGRVSGVFQEIGASATGLVTKLRDGGLKGALSGIMGLFGGPWGLAIGAGISLLGLFAAQQAETKQRVDDFSASLDENTGAITKNTASVAGKSLMDYADTFKELKLSVKDASDAVANGGEPYERMVDKIGRLQAALITYESAQGQSTKVVSEARSELVRLASNMGITEEAALRLNAGAIGHLRNGMMTMRGEVVQTSEEWKTLNTSTKEAEPVALRLAEAIDTVGDSSANTTDRLRAYQDVIDAMNGKTKSAEQVQRDLSKSSRDLAGFLGEVDAAGNRVNAAMAFAADGSIAFNDAGDRLNSMLEPLATRAQTAALAAIDLANSQGRAGDAAKDAEAALAPFRQTLQNLATDGLLSQEQVDRLSASLFGVPGETTAIITDNDSAPAVRLKVEELIRTIVSTPDKEIIITEPLSPAIIEQLNALGFRVETLPNGNIKVTESGADATGAKIDAIASKPRGSTIQASAITAWAEEALNRVARNRTAYIAAQYRDIAVSGGPQVVQPMAKGGLLEYFADGGMRHPKLTPMSPVAQIVPPNTWRVIGDNMKVPELYAPLDGSARSLSLLREGAIRSGFDMVPKGARYFADGGIAQASAVGASGGSGDSGLTVNPSVTLSIDYDRLAEAMSKRPVMASVRIGNRDVAQANIEGRRELRLE